MADKERPRLGCALAVFDNDKLLLGVRGKQPNYGLHVIPGGGVEFLEKIHDGGRREIREELGIEVEIEDLIGAYEIINPPSEHRVILYYRARYKSGVVKPSSDILEARFYARHEVQSLVEGGKVTPIVTKVLEDIGWYVPKR